MHKTTGADGKWHVQALLTNTANDTQARITVVNDRAYYATYNATTMKLLTSQCYSAYMPPLGDLTQVFGNAVFSPASDPPALVTTPECSSRDRFTLQWGPTNVLRSNTFVFCAVADSTFQVGFLRLCGVHFRELLHRGALVAYSRSPRVGFARADRRPQLHRARVRLRPVSCVVRHAAPACSSQRDERRAAAVL